MSFSSDFFVRNDNGSNVIEINPELIEKDYSSLSKEDEEINRICSEYHSNISQTYYKTKLYHSCITCSGIFINFTVMMSCFYLFYLAWSMRYAVDKYLSNNKSKTQYYDPDEVYFVSIIFLAIYVGGLFILSILLFIELLYSVISFYRLEKRIVNSISKSGVFLYELSIASIFLLIGIGFILILPVYQIVYFVYFVYDIDNINEAGLNADGQFILIIAMLILTICCGIFYCGVLFYPLKLLFGHEWNVKFAIDENYRRDSIRKIIWDKRHNYKQKQEKEEKERRQREWVMTHPTQNVTWQSPPSESTSYENTNEYHAQMASNYAAQRRNQELEAYNASVRQHNHMVSMQHSQGDYSNVRKDIRIW